ncbi:MAG: aminotransferase class I/II-fold pyridoxal phosphate-dependent enzyme [Bacillota bacterium]
MKTLSSLTEKFTESVIREMTRVCDAAGGLNLAQGFPDFAPPEEVVRSAEQALREQGGALNQYPVTFGEPALREAIARKVGSYNGITCDPVTDITVTCGATEAMMATLKAVVNPGDEVVIFEPFYENYGPDSILSGATPRFVTLYPPNWTYNPDDLRAAFGPHTKAVIINTPHNPTGKVFTRQELSEIADLCLRWDCLTVTDEVYEHILYDGAKHLSMASLDGMSDRTVTISSASKTYSVTGWRVGWAIAPPEISARIRKVHDFLTVGAPTPFQYGVTAGLGLGEDYYAGLSDRYHKARDFLFGVLRQTGFDPLLPRGAYYIIAQTGGAMARLGVDDDLSFSIELIKRTGVATVPGYSFYHGKDSVTKQARFCFAKSDETLCSVAERLRGLRR